MGYGHQSIKAARGFSRKHGINHFRSNDHDITSRRCSSVLFLEEPPTGLHRLFHMPADLAFSVPALLMTGGTGIFTCSPSTSPFGYALGADLPYPDYPGIGTLGLPASGFFTRFIATHVSILTSDISSKPYSSPSQTYGTLRYRSFEPTISVNGFSPVTFSPQKRLISELLRFL